MNAFIWLGYTQNWVIMCAIGLLATDAMLNDPAGRKFYMSKALNVDTKANGKR